MTLSSLLTTSARMIAAAVVLASIAALPARASLGNGGPIPYPTWHPYLDGVNDGFVYRVNGVNREDLYLAKLVSPSPATANVVGKLKSYVSDASATVSIKQMKASLANDRLVVQYDEQGSDFIDANVDFFDMNTGAFQGFINEQAFAGFNSSVQSSQRFAELKAKYIQMGWVTAAAAASWDYMIDPDDYGVFALSARWNNDGTATVAFTTTVYLANAPGYNHTPAGTETFYINLSFSAATQEMEILDVGNGHATAAYPTVFTFGLQSGTNKMTFLNSPILFNTIGRASGGIAGGWIPIIVQVYATANAIEAEIPAVWQFY